MKTIENRPSVTNQKSENRVTLGQNRRSNTINTYMPKEAETNGNKENQGNLGAKRLSKMNTGVMDSMPNQRCFTFSKDEIEKNGNDKLMNQNICGEDDIQKVVEETKERENRIRKQLEMLREQALAVVAEPNEEKQNDKSELREQLNKYQMELTSVKDTMQDILQYTKKTHNEVQRTKDMVSSIHEATPIKCGSLVIEDFDEQNQPVNPEKYSMIEKPGSDCDEGISIFSLSNILIKDII